MRKRIFPGIAASAILFSACTSIRPASDAHFLLPEGRYRLLVLQPAIKVGLLTAGGNFELREDWTSQARANVTQALMARQAGSGPEIRIAQTHEEVGWDSAVVADLIRLHTVVGSSISTHKYLGHSLPTKRNKFDWTLGSQAVAFGAATNFDYALFLHVQDSFTSSGRAALQAAAVFGCVIGVCSIPEGGVQQAFASLVDLKTGQVVWFNTLASSVGDIRTPEGAKRMVELLLKNMKPDKARQKSALRARRGAP
jgi:hypothetical protein